MNLKFFLVGGMLTLWGAMSHGHARLKASDIIKIRSTNAGVKVGPCGNYARGIPAILSPGQTITVNWEETIYHPGRFEFYFSSADEKNFVLLKSVVNDQKDQPLPHSFSTTLQLPNISCEACTFQMIQVMAENPNNPTYYYSCADMNLRGGAVTPAVTPSPAPPAEECEP